MNPRTIDYGTRPKRNWQFGDSLGHRLGHLMPLVACAIAAATCSIHVMGWRKGNHNGKALRDYGLKPFRGKGRWVHTRMQTLGAPVKNFAMQGPNAKWVHADSFATANEVLECFDGITMTEVLDYYGSPNFDSQLDLSLVDIVTALRPELIR